MSTLLALDLGGTKLAVAVFNANGEVYSKKVIQLNGRMGHDVAVLIREEVVEQMREQERLQHPVEGIGISVPGISRKTQGTVWLPNIPGWEDYPLSREVQSVSAGIPVSIESDRTCYILGERWQGNARNTRDCIFLAVGTGIGAGIIVNGEVLQGAHGISGSVGWMGVTNEYNINFRKYGCLEYHASGHGIARLAKEQIMQRPQYSGVLKEKPVEAISARDVFSAYEMNDPIATDVMNICIHYWGVAVANLISLFNPEKIIFGGGVFGPAVRFIPQITAEASKWAQPISFQQVSIEASALGTDAGIYGAAWLALKQE